MIALKADNLTPLGLAGEHQLQIHAGVEKSAQKMLELIES